MIFSLACKCDDAARAKNKERKDSEQYAGFALHYWGECYGKTRAQLNALMAKGESHRCTGSQKYDGCRKEHNECVGHEFAEVIYEFKAAAPKGKLHFFHLFGLNSCWGYEQAELRVSRNPPKRAPDRMRSSDLFQ